MTGVPAGAGRPGPVAGSSVPPAGRQGGELRVLLGPARTGASAGFLATLRLRPGERFGEHLHPYSEEFLHVVAGTLAVDRPAGPARLDPGQMVLLPRGERHRFRNDGAADALAVLWIGPLAPEPRLGHVDTERPPDPGAAPPAVGIAG